MSSKVIDIFSYDLKWVSHMCLLLISGHNIHFNWLVCMLTSTCPSKKCMTGKNVTLHKALVHQDLYDVQVGTYHHMDSCSKELHCAVFGNTWKH